MSRAVQRTSELERILALPRREPREHEDLRDALTAYLTKPHACHAHCAELNGRQVIRLTPLQTIALVEAHDTGGLFLQAPVGTGKTLISALLPRWLDSQRALLVIPAALRVKTVREFRKLAEHWDVQAPLIESYTRMSRAQAAELLDRYRPDLIILDEGHCVKNRRAAATRRIKRYVRDNPAVRVVDMSGTGAKRSIHDAAHRLQWTLKERCPLPMHESDLLDWSAAVDEKVPTMSRLEPGALQVLCAPEDRGLDGLRRAVGRRIFDTPGAVRSTDPGVDAALYIHCVDLPLTRSEDEAFEILRQTWCTPDGHPIADAVALWRHARELAAGFYYVWNPRAPVDWLRARQEWCATVREILANNRRDLDTEFQVADEIRQALASRRDHPAAAVYQAWRAIKDKFVPNTEPRWIGDTAINAAVKFLGDGGIVWTEHRAFANRLATVAEVPYFGAQGKDAQGRSIEAWEGKACVASIASNGVGRNLQAWSRAWVSSCLPTGTIWEQMLGRLHRQGQEADAVEFTVPISCREVLAGFEQARRDAAFHRDLLAMPTRLCLADVVVPDFSRRGWAWREQADLTAAAAVA